MVVTSQLATHRELSTIYGVEDLHDFLEIVAVNVHNQNLVQKYLTERNANSH